MKKNKMSIVDWFGVFVVIAFVVAVIAFVVGVIGEIIDLSETTPEEYWRLKAELYYEEGVTLECVKDGVRKVLEEDGALVEDVTIKVVHYTGGPEIISARVLFEDGKVDAYEIRMEAWGSTNWALYTSIAGTREMLPEESYWFYGHPDTIKVTKEWLVSTDHYGAWGSPEWVPELENWTTEYDSAEFFKTVRFERDGRRVINIVPKDY